ncbi:hypothetical protein [Pseudodesulfovibrio pelocollis]|uniref:hypothetical protein n=1 Tax=Pseudodesulfovibrio pelocollis TaxID=3051432 RepID=UPI00255B045D|nr:hypothetical protein [Pseudodesulfovibrio sp. SB368]
MRKQYTVTATVIQPISVVVDADSREAAENAVRYGEFDVRFAIDESCANGGYGDVEVLNVEPC